MKIRPATRDDIEALLEIEDEAFTTDKLTRRKLTHLLARGNAALLVAEERRTVAGYALVLFRRGSRAARLYGLAVGSAHRGLGLGARLLRAAETEAARRGCRSMRLEVADANRSAIRLYERAGYSLLARLGPYYEDGSPASRHHKFLADSLP